MQHNTSTSESKWGVLGEIGNFARENNQVDNKEQNNPKRRKLNGTTPTAMKQSQTQPTQAATTTAAPSTTAFTTATNTASNAQQAGAGMPGMKRSHSFNFAQIKKTLPHGGQVYQGPGLFGGLPGETFDAMGRQVYQRSGLFGGLPGETFDAMGGHMYKGTGLFCGLPGGETSDAMDGLKGAGMYGGTGAGLYGGTVGLEGAGLYGGTVGLEGAGLYGGTVLLEGAELSFGMPMPPSRGYVFRVVANLNPKERKTLFLVRPDQRLGLGVQDVVKNAPDDLLDFSGTSLVQVNFPNALRAFPHSFFALLHVKAGGGYFGEIGFTKPTHKLFTAFESLAKFPNPPSDLPILSGLTVTFVRRMASRQDFRRPHAKTDLLRTIELGCSKHCPYVDLENGHVFSIL